MMFLKALVLFGLLALVLGLDPDKAPPQVVENCYERIDACRKLATTNAEIVKKQGELASCLMGFLCDDIEDQSRLKVLMDYGSIIAMAGTDPALIASVQEEERLGRARSFALSTSVSNKSLVLGALVVCALANL